MIIVQDFMGSPISKFLIVSLHTKNKMLCGAHTVVHRRMIGVLALLPWLDTSPVSCLFWFIHPDYC
jgi:hypothetical protein